MRGTLIHVFTGLVLGVALAGLLQVPTELIAQQEARTPVVRPKAANGGPRVEEQTVKVSPRVEQELERQRGRRLSPKTVRPPRRAPAPAHGVLVGTIVPVTRIDSPASQPAQAAAKPKPKRKPTVPPKAAPAPDPLPTPKIVATVPQPTFPPAAEDKAKKPKKHKKSKDKAEKRDKHEKKDKSDKKNKDDRRDHEEDDDDEDDDDRGDDKDD